MLEFLERLNDAIWRVSLAVVIELALAVVILAALRGMVEGA